MGHSLLLGLSSNSEVWLALNSLFLPATGLFPTVTVEEDSLVSKARGQQWCQIPSNTQESTVRTVPWCNNTGIAHPTPWAPFLTWERKGAKAEKSQGPSCAK